MAKKEFTITHSEGCQVAARYLKAKMNCGIVFVEPNPLVNSESPDAIGFRPGGHSILMEVKVTRKDFMSDKRKPHRINPEKGMGDYRFYVCPEGMIKPSELPSGWGLFYFTVRGSLKPVVVPHQLSSLQSPELVRSTLKSYQAQYFCPYPRWLEQMEEDATRFLNAKNHTAEINILYGGYRMQCVAQKQGVPVVINEIFQRPDIQLR